MKTSHSKSSSQLSTISNYLQVNLATATMVSEATGIPQKNICRYKRVLEKKGIIKQVTRDICEVTGLPAWYLSGKL